MRRVKATIGLVCLLLATLLPAAAGEPPPPALGQTVPTFRLPDLGARTRCLVDYKQPVLVLNFWAFWCDTWKAELPQLRELADLQQELDFRLIAVSVDGQWAEARRQLAPGDLAETWGFPVLLDGRKTLARALGIRRVPTVMVLNRERRVVWLREAYPGNPPVLRAIRRALSPP